MCVPQESPLASGPSKSQKKKQKKKAAAEKKLVAATENGNIPPAILIPSSLHLGSEACNVS